MTSWVIGNIYKLFSLTLISERFFTLALRANRLIILFSAQVDLLASPRQAAHLLSYVLLTLQ